jgi:hypothetical protein
MNLHQTPEEIIKAATPEQRILWNDIFLRYGDRLAISQFFFQGSYAGSEFNTYAANKLYFCLDCFLTRSTLQTVFPTTYFYDAANGVNITTNNNSLVWDTTGAAIRYGMNDLNVKNFVFSRIVTDYSGIKFIGYRLGIQ